MIRIDPSLTPRSLAHPAERLFELSGRKIDALARRWKPAQGAPVFTVGGRYASRDWTEWTQGFQFGSALLQFDATGDARALDYGRAGTLRHMAAHLTHIGVHDHGFNTVSTYGNLLRLAREGRISADRAETGLYELALKVSGAVQAARWTGLPGGLGYVYSFNGPHSLFADTIRSLRVLALGHQLGHVLMGEGDRRISLLDRLLTHAETTARFNVYFGEGRDAYDVRGRVAQESIFNMNDGSYRCPGTQQGYSPFSTWTRGLAWILCGYAEQLEFLDRCRQRRSRAMEAGRRSLRDFSRSRRPRRIFTSRTRRRTASPTGTRARRGSPACGDYLDRPADPFNDFEPVDSSAAAIAAQGLIRLGNYLKAGGRGRAGRRYLAAGLTVARTLFSEPYLSVSPSHEGLILHAVYHRPNGWDHVPRGCRIPCGESCMWGDYHARELALLILRMAGRACHVLRLLHRHDRPAPGPVPALRPHDHHQALVARGGGAALRRRGDPGNHGLAARRSTAAIPGPRAACCATRGFRSSRCAGAGFSRRPRPRTAPRRSTRTAVASTRRRPWGRRSSCWCAEPRRARPLEESRAADRGRRSPRSCPTPLRPRSGWRSSPCTRCTPATARP